ncbi:hypothetical protein MZV44_003028 [Listeria monocytogenes]|nr:hypothetical protein [Listeria monocytogenes]
MVKITLNIEAKSFDDLQEALKVFQISKDVEMKMEDSEAAKKEAEKKPTSKKKQVEKSKTADKYLDATKADVQKAMKEALTAGKKDAILTAFSRLNVTKLSELNEEDYSVFLTDLEVLVGE